MAKNNELTFGSLMDPLFDQIGRHAVVYSMRTLYSSLKMNLHIIVHLCLSLAPEFYIRFPKVHGLKVHYAP